MSLAIVIEREFLLLDVQLLLPLLLPLPLSDWSSIYETTISNPIVVFVGMAVAISVVAISVVAAVVVLVPEEEEEEVPDGYMI